MKRKRTTRRRNDIFRCRRMCAHRYILKGKKTHTQNTYQKSLRLCHIIITWWKKNEVKERIEPSCSDTLEKSKETQYPKKKKWRKKADLNWCTKNIRHKSLQQPNDICSEVVLRTSSGLSLFLFTRTRHLISQQQHQRHRRMVFFPCVRFSFFNSIPF